MHLFGYDASSHELYLPLMYGSVYDVLVKKKANDKFVKEDSVRIQVVHTTLEALLRGMVNLHENGVAHRDIKLENLLLDFDPRDQRFGVSSVKISDLGYSLDIRNVAENQLINAQARDELPGTPPHMAPELYQARIDQKEVVQTLIKYAIDTNAGDLTRLRDLQMRNATKDMDKKIKDFAAKAKLEELIGSAVFKSAEFQAVAEEPRKAHKESLAIVQAAPEKLDVFSAAMTAWMLLHPYVTEPDGNVDHTFTDKMRLKRLKDAGRPPTKIQKPSGERLELKDTIDKELFAKLVAAKFFEDGWHTDPTKRISAKTMLGRLEAAMA